MATLSVTPRENIITLDSATAGPFEVGFRIFDADTLNVFVNDVAVTNWTLSASFNLGYTDAATITFDAALEAADVIIIQSDLNPGRDEDYTNGPNIVANLNIELARAWSAIADVRRDLHRALKTFTDNDPMRMVADKAIMVNPTATGFVTGPTADEIENAQTYAEAAQAALEDITDLSATANTLTAGSSATASYDSGTGILTLGIPRGATGAQGPAGTGINPQGSVPTATSLPGYPASYVGSYGDAYITDDTGDMWVWTEDDQWTNFGNLSGPTGPQGDPELFDTRAALVADSSITVGDYVATRGCLAAGDGGHATYRIVAAATGTVDGGEYIDCTGISGQLELQGAVPCSPKVFGCYGDGSTDDTTQLQRWITYCCGLATHTEIVGPKAVVDGQGLQFAVSSGITIPSGSDGAVVRDISLLAIGGGWNSATDYLVTNNSTYTDFYSMALNCDHKCRGWYDSTGSGRVRHWSPQIYQMAEVGYHKEGGGGEVRMFGGQITQYIVSDTNVDELAEEGNYDAIGILMEESDCKIHDTNVRWCGTCYKATGGIQNLYDCHFVQGAAGLYERTNGCLIEWNPAEGTGSGELWLEGCYLDNGYCEFYDDKVNIKARVLVDENDADISTVFIFYAYSGVGECQATAEISFSQWDETTDLFSWESYNGDSWPDDYSQIKTNLSGFLAGGTHQEQIVQLQNNRQIISTNTDGVAQNFFSPNTRASVGFKDVNTTGSRIRFGSKGDTAYVSADDGFDIDALGATLSPQSAEPSGVSNNTISASDGTASTNGFGTSGAGLYIRLSGNWYLLGDHESGSWTPVIADAETGGNTATASTAVGRYSRVGKLIRYSFFLNAINRTGMTGSNTLWLRGFSTTTPNNSAAYGIGPVRCSNFTFSRTPNLIVGPNAAAGRLVQNVSGGASTFLAVNSFTSGSGVLYGSIDLEIA